MKYKTIEEAYLEGYKKGFIEGGIEAINNRPKGKWIDNTCSNCGYTCIFNPYALVERNGHAKEVLSQKFCSNCGADMRGEE